MKKVGRKKSITTNELAALMMKGFDRMQEMFDEFKTEVNQRFNNVDQKFYEIDQRFNKLDRDYDGRLDLAEHRLIAVKNTIEQDLKTPIRW